MNKKDWERIRNVSLFRAPMTDEELEEISPILFVIVIVAIIGFIIYKIFF